MPFRPPDNRTQLLFIAFAMTLAGYALAGTNPWGRIWGFNWWGHLPQYAIPLFVGIGIAVGAVAWLTGGRSRVDDEEMEVSDGHRDELVFRIVATLLLVTSAVLFVLFRSEVHFLGDGYTLLTSLSSDTAVVKARNFGEGWLHIWVRDIVGGPLADAALTSYRIVSATSGVIYTILVLLLARVLYHDLTRRLLFAGILVVSGHALLYFGYVENYSLFVTSIAAFAMFGILVVRGRVSKWWSIPLCGLSTVLHIFGLVLVPATLFLLVRDTRIGRRVGKLPRPTIVVVAIGVIFLSAVALLAAGSFNPSIKYAVVPVVANVFTAGGYTLFSAQHLLDFLNLLFLLIPGLLVLLLLFSRQLLRTMLFSPVGSFLTVLSISALGACFFIDPKIGMPRDWDLLAFSGPPAILWLVTALMDKAEGKVRIRTGFNLAICLGGLLLAGRVAAVNSADVTMRHIQNFVQLDKAKSLSSVMAVRDYYQRSGFKREAAIVDEAIPGLFPEIAENQRALRLSSSGAHQQAISISRGIIASNPAFHMAFANIGVYYARMRQPDSALKYLNIGDAMSPHNPIIHQYRAVAYMQKHEYDQAREALETAYRLDSTDSRIIGTYLQFAAVTGDNTAARRWYDRYAAFESAPAAEFYQVALACMEFNLDSLGGEAFDEALRRGLDSTYIDSITARYPRFTPSP